MAKKCPLLLIAGKGSVECWGNKCAWYVKYTNPRSEGCAIKKLSDSLMGLGVKIITSKKI